MDVNTQPVANGSMNLPPALRDAVANASYNYDEALIAYEDALASRDTGKRSLAEARLHDAAARLSAAQSALVSSRVSVPAKPSFADLLADPRQQLDPTGEVMRSVLAYRTAPVATASATPTWAGDRGPGGPGRRAGRGDGAGGGGGEDLPRGATPTRVRCRCR